MQYKQRHANIEKKVSMQCLPVNDDAMDGSAAMESGAEFGIAPAYAAMHPDRGSNPQCSGSTNFCFLCEYQDNGGEEDLYRDIKTLIKTMIDQKREQSAIVSHVFRTYEDCVRDHAEWRRGTEIIKRPKWSRDSIYRHLTYSTEFRDAFDDIIERTFHSIMLKTNDHMVDEEGRIVEAQRKAFVDTVKAYNLHRKSRAK
jgi:hypothetical protein